MEGFESMTILFNAQLTFYHYSSSYQFCQRTNQSGWPNQRSPENSTPISKTRYENNVTHCVMSYDNVLFIEVGVLYIWIQTLGINF